MVANFTYCISFDWIATVLKVHDKSTLIWPKVGGRLLLVHHSFITMNEIRGYGGSDNLQRGKSSSSSSCQAIGTDIPYPFSPPLPIVPRFRLVLRDNQTGDISTLNSSSLTLVESSVSSTETDIDTRLTKAWTAFNWQSVIWKSDLADKMKRSFFQAAIVSILLYGCTTWTLTKRLEKKFDGN